MSARVPHDTIGRMAAVMGQILAGVIVVGIGKVVDYVLACRRRKRQKQRRRELIVNIALVGLVVSAGVLVVLAVRHARHGSAVA